MTLRQLPWAMVGFRFFAGPVLLWMALTGQSRFWLIGVLFCAFLSDVFDGVIARRMNAVTASLRVADSWVDTVFYLCVASAIWFCHRGLVLPFAVPLLVVIVLMGINWLLAMSKFRRPLSFHAYSSKLWGASLFAASVSILGFSYAGVFLWLTIFIGIAGHLEGFIMTLLLPCWTHDVSGIPEALRLRHESRTQP